MWNRYFINSYLAGMISWEGRRGVRMVRRGVSNMSSKEGLYGAARCLLVNEGGFGVGEGMVSGRSIDVVGFESPPFLA